MYRSKQQIKRIYAIAFIVGGLFLVCSLMLLRHATRQIEQINIIHLYETTTQLRILLQRQLAQNFQTLHGLATTVSYMSQHKTLPLHKEIRNNSNFTHIGLIAPSGRGDMADAQGIVARNVDFSEEDSFRAARAG